MKVIKVSELEAILGKEPTLRLVSALEEKRKPEPKPLPMYEVIVAETHREVFSIQAKSEVEAEGIAKQKYLSGAKGDVGQQSLTAQAHRADREPVVRKPKAEVEKKKKGGKNV